MLRAIWATGSGAAAKAMAPITCQRALLRPISATSLSPAASNRPFRRKTSTIKSATAAAFGDDSPAEHFMDARCHIDSALSTWGKADSPAASTFAPAETPETKEDI